MCSFAQIAKVVPYLRIFKSTYASWQLIYKFIEIGTVMYESNKLKNLLTEFYCYSICTCVCKTCKCEEMLRHLF